MSTTRTEQSRLATLIQRSNELVREAQKLKHEQASLIASLEGMSQRIPDENPTHPQETSPMGSPLLESL